MAWHQYLLTISRDEKGLPFFSFDLQQGDGDAFFTWFDDGDSFLSTVLSTEPRSLLDSSGVPCAPCSVQLDVYGHYSRGDGWETDDDAYTESVFTSIVREPGEPFAACWEGLAADAWEVVVENYEQDDSRPNVEPAPPQEPAEVTYLQLLPAPKRLT